MHSYGLSIWVIQRLPAGISIPTTCEDYRIR